MPGVTTFIGSMGLFGTLATTNHSNLVIPSVWVVSGTGDKWILLAGTASIYPDSLGIIDFTVTHYGNLFHLVQVIIL